MKYLVALLALHMATAACSGDVVNDDDRILNALKQAAELQSEFRDEEALNKYLSVLARERDHYEALYNVVFHYLTIGERQNRNRDARRYYETAHTWAKRLMAAYPENAGAHFAYAAAVGNIAQTVGIRQQARLSVEIRTHAEKAIRIDPEHAGAWSILGEWHHQAASLSRVERFTTNLLFGSEVLAGASNTKAREAMAKAIELDPGVIRYYHQKARFLMNVGDKRRARRIIEQGLALEENLSNDREWKDKLRKLRDELGR